MTYQEIKANLITVLDKWFKNSPEACQTDRALRQAATELQIDNDTAAIAILLEAWNDLFLQGFLGWGSNLAKPNPPDFHFRDASRKFLENFSRDPFNPAGYSAYLSSIGYTNPAAESYAAEAILALNANCHRSAAVMIGAASEALLLELRNAVFTKLTQLSAPIPKSLNHWMVKTFSQELNKQFEQRRHSMPRELEEIYDANWSSLTGTLRITRNDAGHPKALGVISRDSAHASLLLFPEMAKLFVKLQAWVQLWT